MSKLFSKIRQDTCINCGRDQAIDLYDYLGNRIDFSLILNTNKYVVLDRRQIFYARCKFCKHKFMLDWNSSDRIPRPLSENNFKLCLQHYNKFKVI